MDKELEKQIKGYLENEEYSIRIKAKDGFIQLVNFVKYIENEEVIFAFKIKNCKRVILLYKKENMSIEEKGKLKRVLDYFLTEPKYKNYKVKEIGKSATDFNIQEKKERSKTLDKNR